MRPVQSIKHIVDTDGLISLAVQSVTPIVNTVRNPDYAANPADVEIGSTVSSIYLRVEATGVIAAAGIDNIYMAVVKNPAGALSFPKGNQMGGDDNRRWILHQEMLMLAPFEATGTTGFPRTLFKGVIRIPRGMKRNALEDQLQVLLSHRGGETSQTTRFCLECIYKEFN